MSLVLKTIVNNPVASNCYILYDDSNGHCLLIDPGSEDSSETVSFLSEQALSPDYILLTHEHFDHIWSCEAIKSYFNTAIVCSRLCSVGIQNRKKNLSLFYNQVGIGCPDADIILEDVHWRLDWNGSQILFHETGGHSDGGTIFTVERYLFTGDILLKNIKTATKLRLGSKEKLKQTIEFLATLKGNGYWVCAGHGDGFDLDNYDLTKAF